MSSTGMPMPIEDCQYLIDMVARAADNTYGQGFMQHFREERARTHAMIERMSDAEYAAWITSPEEDA